MSKKVSCIYSVLLMGVFIVFNSFAQHQISLLEERGDETKLRFTMSESDYTISTILINGSKYDVVGFKGSFAAPRGVPNLPHVAQSMIIPDKPEMNLEIVDSKFKEISVNPIAPSKGSFSREIKREDVAYEFGAVYRNRGCYPAQSAKLGRPYILRDFRANVVYFHPFVYNTQTKTLRVYTEITIKVSPTDKIGINVKNRKKPLKIGPSFNFMYSRRFINYSTKRYDPVDEEGTMLIISDGGFMTAMEPFIDWKNRRGLTTEIVDIADVGNDVSSIASYVAEYYANNELKYLLLVGDADEVTPSSNGGKSSDNIYGQIEGDDAYVELFVGRFSGTTSEHIQTQVDKTLHMERNMTTSDTWLSKAFGTFSSSEKDDRNCIDSCQKLLEGFTFSSFGKEGGKRRQGSLLDAVEDGISCHIASSHGNKTGIACLRLSNVSGMSNEGMYPYNFTLSCSPGTFAGGSDCLAEGLLKRSGGGYVGAFMGSLTQPWWEPYAGVHEFANIITEQQPDNIKRTYGGLCNMACAHMLDEFPSSGVQVSDCWVLFGDPSLLVYTDVPAPLTINHPAEAGNGSQDVEVSGTEDATVCLYSKEQGIQEVNKLEGGSATFSIEVTTEDTIYVTATLFNHETYEGFMTVVTGPYISVAFPNGGEVLDQGKEVEITWNSSEVDKVKIELLKAGASALTIAGSEDSDGSYTWKIPDDIEAGIDYKICITQVSVNTITDESNEDFTIYKAPVFASDPMEKAGVDVEYVYEIKVEGGIPSDLVIEASVLPDWLEFKDEGDGKATLKGTPQIGDLGDHDVALTVTDGIIGTAVEQAFTIVVADVEPPVITQHPEDVEVDMGQDATFSVKATGDDLSYRWQKKGKDDSDFEDISGATEDTYTLSKAKEEDDQSIYRCIVSNPAGDFPSEEATLTVIVTAITNHVPVNVLGATRLIATPNPADKNVVFMFSAEGIIKSASVKVFDHVGNIVFEANVPALRGDDEGLRLLGTWDLRNSSGRLVAGDTYIAVLEVKKADGTVEGVKTFVGIREN